MSSIRTSSSNSSISRRIVAVVAVVVGSVIALVYV